MRLGRERWGEVEWHVQVCFHCSEGFLGLVEEVEDDAPAELAVVLVLVHFEDLGGYVNASIALY
jgi:hypothetical protein